MLLQLKALVPELSDETIADAVAKTAADYDIVRQGRYYYDKTDFIAERGMAAKVAALANEMPTKEKEIENAFSRMAERELYHSLSASGRGGQEPQISNLDCYGRSRYWQNHLSSGYHGCVPQGMAE